MSAAISNFDELYTTLRQSIEELEVSVADLTFIIMKAMRLVEDVAEKGAVKKALVIRLIERLIDEVPMDAATKETVQAVFASIGPSIIEGLVEADHTQFLKKSKSWLKRVCKCCTGK